MTTVNLSQQQYRDARKQFGRSTIVQLLIFMGIELGVEVLFYVINLFQNFLFNVVSNRYSIEIGMQFSSISSFVFNCFTFIILVGVLFLHRSVTFRSSDTVMHNALPLAGMLLVNRIIFWIIALILNQFIPTPEYRRSDYIIVLYLGFYALYILFAAAIDFAQAGTIHFARKKGSRILLILPLMGFLLLAVSHPLINYCSNYCFMGMTRRLYSSLPTLLSNLIFFVLNTLLPYLITGLASFFAMRLLVYRDSYDTSPKAQQKYLQRYVQANPQLFQQNTPDVPEQTADTAPME